jgi:hypothetical protein
MTTPPTRTSRTRKRPRSSNESALKARIVRYLRARGIFCWRAGAGPYQRAGLPDILAILEPCGTLLGVEAKMPGEFVTPIQARTIAEMRLCGAIIVVAYNVDDVERALSSTTIPSTTRSTTPSTPRASSASKSPST